MKEVVARACVALLALTFGPGAGSAPDGDWRSYGHDPGGARYSPLAQIDRTNVARLARAWTYHTGDVEPDANRRPTPFETTPLAVNGTLFLSTPSGRVVALDGDSGRALWTFDPPLRAGRTSRPRGAHRGVAYWESADAKDRRIVYGTPDGRLIALDAQSGALRADFGRGGIVDLRGGVADRWPDAAFGVTSPPAIYRDLVIVGSQLQEFPALGPAGDVRAWDVRSGALVWTFHSVPRPGEHGSETWEGSGWKDRSGVNVWSIMSVDAARGLVFLPLGSASYDFYGGDRKGDNLFANSIVALDAATGARRWHFQTVHHDVWDYDVPAQPLLLNVRRGGRDVAAVAQVTKTGFVFVLDRETGKPLFDVVERPVPAGTLPGERLSPTQPIPQRPPPLVRQSITRAELTRVTPESQQECAALFDSARNSPLFTPPGLELTLTFPGTLGGANWSGAAFDPSRRRLYVNANEVGALGRMAKAADGAPLPYRRAGPDGEYSRFWDKNRWPCQQPPWGTFNAVDLDEGTIAWKVPLGVVDALVARGVPPTGVPSLGGSIATAGGVLFIAGTNDARFRAFDADDGRELWSDRLEANGHATPMTYRGASGRQYVAIAAGGGGYFSRETSDVVAAYALPGAETPPPADAFRVLEPAAEGPSLAPYLRLQLDRAWAFDEARRRRFDEIRSEADLRTLQAELRRELLASIGGLPELRAPLNARIVGSIPRAGYRVEKLIFESLPGIHVTALVYVPDGPATRRPAVLLPAGHSPIGKAHPAYQEIAARLALRGYVVLSWDPVGQGERSQFWDAEKKKSRHNLVCGEHAVLGNLATLAGLGIGRYFVWDGMRALDYLVTRDDVDAARVSVTGNSGGGYQSAWLGALDERVRVVAPSCFVTSLPMRMANRIYEDPDSDPEQDPDGLVSRGIDHAGLLLLAFPKPIHLSAAIKDFFPIEGTRKTFREIASLYRRLGQGDRIALSEGYHTHGYSPENQESAFAFLDRWNGLPIRRGIAKIETLPEESLRCTKSGQVRVDLPGRSLVAEIQEQAAARGPAGGSRASSLYRASAAPDVRQLRLVPYDASKDAPDAIAWEAAGSSEHAGVVIDRYRLRHSGRLLLPVLHVHKRGVPSERTVIDFGLDGKAGPAEWPLLLEHVNAGRDVVSFDARGLGETRMGHEPLSAADPLASVLGNLVYNAQLLGRPYALEMVEDVEIAARFARERLGARTLALSGRGDARVVAALAGDLLGVETLTGGGLDWWAATLRDARETWPIPLLLPGGALLRPSSR